MSHSENGYLFYVIGVGQCGRAIMPHSEACEHLKVAGEYMDFVVLPNSMVQLYKPTENEEDRFIEPFSFPIRTGEAGLYDCESVALPDPYHRVTTNTPYYYYPHGLRDGDEELANRHPISLRRAHMRAADLAMDRLAVV